MHTVTEEIQQGLRAGFMAIATLANGAAFEIDEIILGRSRRVPELSGLASG